MTGVEHFKELLYMCIVMRAKDRVAVAACMKEGEKNG